jgi:hypothetical protein
MSDQNAGLEEEAGNHSIFVDEEVIKYIQERNTDFRISTSCGGPVLLPISYKPPKSTDLVVKAGERVIYISMYQMKYIDHIHMGLVPYHIGQRENYIRDQQGF